MVDLVDLHNNVQSTGFCLFVFYALDFTEKQQSDASASTLTFRSSNNKADLTLNLKL